MKRTTTRREEKEMSLSEIRALMKLAEPTPCEIIQRLPLIPGVEEEAEFYGVNTESDRDRSSEETD